VISYTVEDKQQLHHSRFYNFRYPSTPPYAPPGLKQLEDSPSPAVEPTDHQACEVLLSTSSIHVLQPSTPGDFISVSASDQIASVDCYEALIPEELLLEEWEMPKVVPHQSALKPQAISETDCLD